MPNDFIFKRIATNGIVPVTAATTAAVVSVSTTGYPALRGRAVTFDVLDGTVYFNTYATAASTTSFKLNGPASIDFMMPSSGTISVIGGTSGSFQVIAFEN